MLHWSGILQDLFFFVDGLFHLRPQGSSTLQPVSASPPLKAEQYPMMCADRGLFTRVHPSVDPGLLPCLASVTKAATNVGVQMSL